MIASVYEAAALQCEVRLHGDIQCKLITGSSKYLSDGCTLLNGDAPPLVLLELSSQLSTLYTPAPPVDDCCPKIASTKCMHADIAWHSRTDLAVLFTTCHYEAPNSAPVYKRACIAVYC
jgi:hypothetical protein